MYKQVISLGYRCSSAGILKSLGLKNASYPFDWLVSHLPIIEYCVADQFKEFLNPLNYTKKRSATYHYPNHTPQIKHWICDETILYNHLFEKNCVPTHIPAPLNPETDAYAHQLMMNHHDITNERDRAYYERCVERWTTALTEENQRILTLYIHPAISHEDFKESRRTLEAEIRRFHQKLLTPNDGIYIIPVRTEYEDPTTQCAKYVLEEQPDDPDVPNCRICILWTNNGFIDAGEIFMGRCHVEEYVVKEYVQTVVQLGHLPKF